jgi:hypothetical protein
MITRLFIYCALVSMALVFCASGGKIPGLVDGQIAAGLTAVLWLICMTVRLIIKGLKCAHSRLSGESSSVSGPS